MERTESALSAASFIYDGLGRRQKKTIGASPTEFLYDGVNPVQETSGATVLANILTGLGIDEFFSRTDVPAATTSHFLPDGLRSAVALTDPAGAVQTEYTYEPFGRTTVTGVLPAILSSTPAEKMMERGCTTTVPGIIIRCYKGL